MLFETRKEQARVISFFNQKGGVGKTTLAFHTAHALAKTGATVLCIDLDPQANLTHLFNIDLGPGDVSIYHLLINSVRELKSLHTACSFSEVVVTERGAEIDLLPSSQILSGFDLNISSIREINQFVVKNFLYKNGLFGLYDYILIDCPPTLGLLVVNALCASQGVLVPFRPDRFSLKGLKALYELLDHIDAMGIVDAPKVLAHIPNLVDRRRKEEANMLKKFQEGLKLYGKEGDRNLTTPFFNRVELSRSETHKKSIYHYNSKDYKILQSQFNDLALKIREWSNA